MFEDDDLERALARARPEDLRRRLERLFAQPPTRMRDGEIALVYLILAQRVEGRERERSFVAGYAYARTSRHPAARRLAERLKEAFAAWKR